MMAKLVKCPRCKLPMLPSASKKILFCPTDKVVIPAKMLAAAFRP